MTAERDAIHSMGLIMMAAHGRLSFERMWVLMKDLVAIQRLIVDEGWRTDIHYLFQMLWNKENEDIWSSLHRLTRYYTRDPTGQKKAQQFWSTMGQIFGEPPISFGPDNCEQTRRCCGQPAHPVKFALVKKFS